MYSLSYTGLPPGDFSLLERFMQCGQVATEVEMCNINKAESFILRNYMLSLQATQVQDFCVYHPRGKFDKISRIFTGIWLYTADGSSLICITAELLPLCLTLIRNLIFASDQILYLYAEWNCPN